MVNTGHPSAGCELCRQRKIRCDETKPACRKCTKYGRVCPGYRDLAALSLSKKNRQTKQAVFQHQQASKSAPIILEAEDQPAKEDQEDRHVRNHSPYSLSPQTPVHSFSASRSASPSSLYQYPVSPSLSHSYVAVEPAIHCLFSSRAFAACVVTDPDLDSVGMIKDMYQDTAYGSCLDTCVKAAAFANLANRLDRSDLHVEARIQYGNAMNALNNALQSPTDRISDETLLAMLMMRVCEFFFGLQNEMGIFNHKTGAADDWLNHLGGASAILRMRGLNQLSTPQGRWLFDITFRSEICQMFLKGRGDDEYLSQLEDQLDLFQQPWMYSLLAMYRFYLRDSLRIRWRVKLLCELALSQPYQQTLTEINSLIQAVANLELELQRWREGNPSYEPQSIPLHTTQTARLPHILTKTYYQNAKAASYHQRLLFTQFKLHESLVQGLSVTLEALERQQGISPTRVVTSASFAAVDKHLVRHLATLDSVAAELLGSTSYMLGDLDERGQVIEFEHERSVSGYSPHGSGRSSPHSIQNSTPAIEISFSDGFERQAFRSDEYPKRNYPSRLRTIETYVHLAFLQACPVLASGTSEGQSCLKSVAGMVARRAIEELRGS